MAIKYWLYTQHYTKGLSGSKVLKPLCWSSCDLDTSMGRVAMGGASCSQSSIGLSQWWLLEAQERLFSRDDVSAKPERHESFRRVGEGYLGWEDPWCYRLAGWGVRASARWQVPWSTESETGDGNGRGAHRDIMEMVSTLGSQWKQLEVIGQTNFSYVASKSSTKEGKSARRLTG